MLSKLPVVVLLAAAFLQQNPSASPKAASESTSTNAPPISMGLWQTTVTSTFSGSVAMPTHTTKYRSCATAENWASLFQERNRGACTVSNESLSGAHYAADFACPQGVTGHVDVGFPNASAGHGTVHMQGDINGRHMVADSVTDARFVSASCGNVSPDHAVVVP